MKIRSGGRGPLKILDILPQTEAEWTFRVANNRPIRHGQFMQLSLPRLGEAPISVSGFGDGYADFTIRKVGKVTDGLFSLRKGDSIFLRGCYGNGWPVEQFGDQHVVIVAGGTGVASAKSLIDMLYADPGYARDVHLRSRVQECPQHPVLRRACPMEERARLSCHLRA